MPSDIRVPAVASIPSTVSADQVSTFGSNVPLKRPGLPDELTGCYVLLAPERASDTTGQTWHPDGGAIVAG